MLAMPFLVKFLPPTKKAASSSVRIQSLVTSGRIVIGKPYLVLGTSDDTSGSWSALLIDDHGFMMWQPFSGLKFAGLYTGQKIQLGESYIEDYELADSQVLMPGIDSVVPVPPPAPAEEEKKAPEGAKKFKGDRKTSDAHLPPDLPENVEHLESDAQDQLSF